MKLAKQVKTLAAALALGFSAAQAQAADQSLLNSSYDIARELFASYNEHFADYWKNKTGQTVEIRQSHGGSSRQAQAIIQGLRADVVTYNQVTDVDVLHERGNLLPADWREQLPNASSPYYSTMAYLVRKGNPKNIQNWDDLAREDVSSVFPNPKTSGNGRYTYLAAYGYAQQVFGDDQAAIDAFVRTFLNRVAVFDTGGRGATTTFVERGIGDVLLTFESEVNNIIAEYPDHGFEVVVPKVSFLAEFPVAVVERHAERNGNLELARAYLEELYSEDAQRLLAGFNYRVHNETVQAEFADQFPPLELLTIEQIAGSWESAMTEHFANGGKLDQLQRR
ncbi:Sulfate and thiosulfate binding protein CysP [Nitrincola lacisaponensis]|uniref:Sulfate and thiosulfate binding protein CysP n=1 Tax=Nitrincola lacisaponensis TaxID=267850 RepID=A0A063XYK1_9GAMM|nr:thiosulfate ABC transporter substrate-binding protein CysP [Nitrincola lacisaponensis]KDE38579.1 Sulfate and thiosulfate binding protein CysP [Nitrincola lacisaponensis]